MQITRTLPMQDFRTLKAWQQAHELAIDLLRASTHWSLGDLSNIVRQTALLMPATLARGCNGTAVGLIAAVRNTHTHLDDLKAFLLLARDLDEVAACDYAAFELRFARLSHQLNALRRTVRRHPEAVTLN